MRPVLRCAVASFAIAHAAAAQQPATRLMAAGGSSRMTPVPSAQIGRVSLVLGKVSFRALGDTAWSAATINDPVATGAALRTDPAARAELRIGADTIDLARGTEISLARLDDSAAEIAVRSGRIDLDVPRPGAGDSIVVDFPRGRMRILEPGRYDVDVGADDRPPRIAAYTGSAQLVEAATDTPIKAGDALVLSGADTTHAVIEPSTADDFARWCGARAIALSRLASPYFVSTAMTGFAALDAAGRWRKDLEFGEVWVPNNVPAGWVPFRDGHWRWVAPWGWTWIDDQPWGFATSHYGRWAFAGGRWEWVPGRFTLQPVYAPAVVAFLGTPGVGLSYANGPGPAIAWFPLAPGEAYWPSYTEDVAAIRALNRGNIANLDIIRVRSDGEPPLTIAAAHFANRLFASVVPRPVFVAGEAVAPALLDLPPRRLQNAPAILGSPRIGPPPPPAAVAAASHGGIHPHPARHAAGLAAKRAAWARTVRAAMIRVRNYRRSLLIRAAHLRVPGYAALRLRDTIVLRVAGPVRLRHPTERRRKKLER
ncbi:MAG TPA: DUF6600 domain-containing protein [Stellaceae bacterium]|nr:DUF6600 domain-containing protein [Stellaceae bacterium]